MTGFTGTFGSDTDQSHTGDNADYPNDNQLRVLQAVGPRGRVIATLVNYAAHPTVYGPLDKVSPDWPGATATFLEHDERNLPATLHYGYPGSAAVVTVGAIGHTWPAGTPRGNDPATDPPASSDNYPADHFGNSVARMAIAALGHPATVKGSRVGGVTRDIDVTGANPALIAMLDAPVPGYHIMRSNQPPYAYGDVFVSRAQALRIGNLPWFGGGGELYPSIQKSLASEVHAPVTFTSSLSDDQLGYIEEVADYNGAAQCSTGDEWFFTISPLFGTQEVRAARANASALGFRVTAPPPPGDSGPGQIPPSTNCTAQQAQQAGLPLPLPSLP